jgi:hypothetical protein
MKSLFTRRQPQPIHLVLLLFIVEIVLVFSEWFHWFPFNETKGMTVCIAIACIFVTIVALLIWFLVSTLCQLRFQFTIRHLLALTFVVAIPFSWLAVELKRASAQKYAIKEIYKLHGDVRHQYFSCFIRLDPSYRDRLAGVFGVEFVDDVIDVRFIDAGDVGAGLSIITQFPYLQTLSLQGSQFSENDFKCIKSLVTLDTLCLKDTHINDSMLENLEELSLLQELDLENTDITDAGLIHLKGLSKLKTLILSKNNITNEGIKYLQKLPNLKLIRLHETKVTDEGAESLRQLMPNCKIPLYIWEGWYAY